MCLGGDKETKQTQEAKPADWSYWPELEKFWDSYVHAFWGDEEDPGYKEMIQEDFDYLKERFDNYDKSLQEIEQMNRERLGANLEEFDQNTADLLSRRRQESDTNLQQLRGTPISLGGTTIGNWVPKWVGRNVNQIEDIQNKRTANEYGRYSDLFNRRANTYQTLYGLETQQPQRDWVSAQAFTPNKVNLDYLNKLEQLGLQGQNYRAAMPTRTATSVQPGSVIGDLGSLLMVGALGYGLGGDLGLWGSGASGGGLLSSIAGWF